MAYDDALADRVRAELADEPELTERKMFGGIAWLVGGNLAVGVRGEDLMVRVGAEGAPEALARPYARQSYMGEREMKGWILVAPDGVADDADLADWIRNGAEYARSLPAKS
jgi:TfoX/Sxy family transcriptional regulator of competence genes